MRILALLVLTACEPPDPCADSQVAQSGLILTQDTHPLGREEGACFDCHVLARIHQDSCLPEGAVDDGRSFDVSSDCTSCHGNNGLGSDTGVVR
mgnify:CR=1 FL=1